MAAKGKDQSSYGTVSASPAPTNVQVIAPATLQAGYTFDAMYDGVTFTVTVPSGGVTKGQRFIVPFSPPSISDAVAVAIPASSPDTPTTAAAANAKKAKGTKKSHAEGGTGIPSGIWRDGLCDCCRFGPFHPHFFNSLCFKPFIMGQLLTRMKMTWCGQRTHENNDATAGTTPNNNASRLLWKSTFKNIVIISLLYYGMMMLTTTNATIDLDDYDEQSSQIEKLKYQINYWMSMAFGCYIFYILVQLRATMRHVYSIPEESCLFWYKLLGLFGTNPREGLCGSGSGESSVCTAGVPVAEHCLARPSSLKVLEPSMSCYNGIACLTHTRR